MSFNQTNSPPQTHPFDTPSIGDESPLNLILSGEWVRDLLPIEWLFKSRSLRLLVRWGGMSGDMVWATIDNDNIKAKKNPTIL